MRLWLQKPEHVPMVIRYFRFGTGRNGAHLEGH